MLSPPTLPRRSPQASELSSASQTTRKLLRINRPGRVAGAQGYNQADMMGLSRIIASIKPFDRPDWQRVVEIYNTYARSNRRQIRNSESVRNKFKAMLAHPKSPSEPDCPEHIRIAKRAKLAIDAAALLTIEDSQQIQYRSASMSSEGVETPVEGIDDRTDSICSSNQPHLEAGTINPNMSPQLLSVLNQAPEHSPRSGSLTRTEPPSHMINSPGTDHHTPWDLNSDQLSTKQSQPSDHLPTAIELTNISDHSNCSMKCPTRSTLSSQYSHEGIQTKSEIHNRCLTEDHTMAPIFNLDQDNADRAHAEKNLSCLYLLSQLQETNHRLRSKEEDLERLRDKYQYESERMRQRFEDENRRLREENQERRIEIERLKSQLELVRFQSSWLQLLVNSKPDSHQASDSDLAAATASSTSITSQNHSSVSSLLSS